MRALLSLWSWIVSAAAAAAAGGKKKAVAILVNGKVNGMNLITLDQKLPITAQPVDAAQNPAKLAGPPTWTLSDPSVGTLAVAADGLSGTFSPTALGSVQVRVEGDADLGPGTKLVFGTLDISVESGQAVQILVLAGTPVPK